MGILAKSVRLFQDITSLGGTWRIRAERKRYAGLSEGHALVSQRLWRYNASLAGLKDEIEHEVDIARRHLRTAGRILKYAPGLSLEPVLSPAVAESAELVEVSPDIALPPAPWKSMKTTAPTVTGLGTGAATSAGTWATVTHTSVAALPPAALAGYAATARFAGLSGGTAAAILLANPLAIPGVGAAVALVVSTGMSYKRASRLSSACVELKKAYVERSSDLEKIRFEVETLEALESKLRNQDRELWRAISYTRNVLFPLGPLSHLWRVMTLPMRRTYYSPRELPMLEQLDEAVTQFVSAFKGRPVWGRPNQPATV